MPPGASFPWYTYSPTRVRHPHVRGVLLELYREARERLGDPVAAWAEVTGDPEKRRRYQAARGKGGLVRIGWDEALEIAAAAHVHTIGAYGPDRVAGFSPIPAMSMASHAVGARFMALIGAPMISFYDWYADLPIASPQVFGDQTDVPESGDWWDAAYLMLWGSNVPVPRTPDAHWMAEARYRGQKVVVVSPDYADATKFADVWLHPHPGTDGALAMAMGHVILTECFVRRQVPYFTEYVRQFTDLPFLVELEQGADGLTPGKFLTAADLGLDADAGAAARWKPVLVDAVSGRPVVPNGTLGDRWSKGGIGRQLAAGAHRVAGPSDRLLGQGQRVLPAPPAGGERQRAGAPAGRPVRYRPVRPRPRPSAAGHRRQTVRGDPRAVQDDQRAAGGRGLRAARRAVRSGQRLRRAGRGGPGAPGGVLRHPGPAGPGRQQLRVVRQGGPGPALRPVHPQHRAPQALAHPDRASALLPRPRLDGRAGRATTGIPDRR